jgi:hypothetical protein
MAGDFDFLLVVFLGLFLSWFIVGIFVPKLKLALED